MIQTNIQMLLIMIIFGTEGDVCEKNEGTSMPLNYDQFLDPCYTNFSCGDDGIEYGYCEDDFYEPNRLSEVSGCLLDNSQDYLDVGGLQVEVHAPDSYGQEQFAAEV